MEHAWTRKALDKKQGMTAGEIASILDTVPRHSRVRAVVGFRGQVQQITATWETEQALDAIQARVDDIRARWDDTRARWDDTRARWDDTRARWDDTRAQVERVFRPDM